MKIIDYKSKLKYKHKTIKSSEKMSHFIASGTLVGTRNSKSAILKA